MLSVKNSLAVLQVKSKYAILYYFCFLNDDLDLAKVWFASVEAQDLCWTVGSLSIDLCPVADLGGAGFDFGLVFFFFVFFFRKGLV